MRPEIAAVKLEEAVREQRKKRGRNPNDIPMSIELRPLLPHSAFPVKGESFVGPKPTLDSDWQ